MKNLRHLPPRPARISLLAGTDTNWNSINPAMVTTVSTLRTPMQITVFQEAFSTLGTSPSKKGRDCMTSERQNARRNGIKSRAKMVKQVAHSVAEETRTPTHLILSILFLQYMNHRLKTRTPNLRRQFAPPSPPPLVATPGRTS